MTLKKLLVGSSFHHVLVFFIPYSDAAQPFRVFCPCHGKFRFNNFVYQHVLHSFFRQVTFFNPDITDIVLVPHDKEHMVAVPRLSSA